MLVFASTKENQLRNVVGLNKSDVIIYRQSFSLEHNNVTEIIVSTVKRKPQNT